MLKEGRDVRQRALVAADGSRTSCVTMAMVEVQTSMPSDAGGPPQSVPWRGRRTGQTDRGKTAHCGTTQESEKSETAEVQINRPVENKLECSCFRDIKHLLK